MPELLLELLSEEIPARMQARAAEDLRRLVCDGLAKARFTYGHAQAFVTPRRLAIVVDGLSVQQPSLGQTLLGPRVGAPDQAIQGFLRSVGGAISDLEQRELKKGKYYVLNKYTPGRPTVHVLADLLPVAINELRWPKSMRWGSSDFRWVRPLHNILAVFNGQIISFSFALAKDGAGCGSIESNARTSGHRFMAPGEFIVTGYADYVKKLEDAYVIVDPQQRKKKIVERFNQLSSIYNIHAELDDKLLDEVIGLVEWPVVHVGTIDQNFLLLPTEVLSTSMKLHQKYFSAREIRNNFAAKFFIIANIESTAWEAIVAGNERVLRARLSDAKFFWDEDRKRTLESRVPRLSERVFHAELGSDLQRTERLVALARVLAPSCGAGPAGPVVAGRAARLCKADLTSAMVGEFPELQGVMGRYYALHDGEQPVVADAIADHYAPQGPSDRCPTAPVSITVALADKIDTLAGFFAIGQAPTGSRDPFALRRAALGVLRIIIENRLRLNLLLIFTHALEGYSAIVGDRRQAVSDELLAFFADRLKVHLREQGVRHDLIAAVFSAGGEAGAEDDIVRLLARVDALRAFLDTDDGANLLTAYRRATNIVRIEENKDSRRYQGEAEEALLAENQEVELHRALSAARSRIGQALGGEQFEEAMTILAALRAPVDAFFDHVKVNCANADLRVNRLKLLSQIRSALGGVADFSQIEG